MYELIIVDNGSISYTGEISCYYSYFSEADVLIRNRKNLGFAPACNQGFALARGEFVICLNNDILVWPGWLEEMVRTFDLDVFQPPLGVLMPALVKNLRDGREAIKLEKIDLTSNHDQYGPHAEFGSLWMMRRSLMEEIRQRDGYVFDENFRGGFGEDRDLWDRVRLLGYETYRTHNTRVFHQGNMSMTKLANRKELFTFPNREYLAQKRELRKQKYGNQGTNQSESVGEGNENKQI